MRCKHLFLAPECIVGDCAILRGDDLHHVVRVLRLPLGAEVTFVDGTGSRYRGELAELRAGEGVIAIAERRALSPERPPRLVLVHGVARGAHEEWTLQKSTELGVDEIIPAVCERSVSRPADSGRKRDRWHEIVRQAARQCERHRLPEVRPAQPFAQALALCDSAQVKLIAALEGSTPLAEHEAALRAATGSDARVALAVGPEGGFTDPELALARTHGFLPVHLGPNVLRTETAALAFLAIVAHLTGRLAVTGG